MNLSDVLIKPLLTEKITMLKEENMVAFLVAPLANKIEIGKAVEKAFDVKVKSVNVLRRKPRNLYRQGRLKGRKAGWKKAYVTLAEGGKISLFEGV